VEAEAMKLEGFAPLDVTPWEAASGGKAVTCAEGPSCAATWKFDGAPGWYTLRVQYFDMPNGVARYKLLVGRQTVDEWSAADHIPSRRLDAGASSRRVIPGIALRPGDEIRIEGFPDRGDPAGLDYIEIVK
jgi:alpha-glucuronidase